MNPQGGTTPRTAGNVVTHSFAQLLPRSPRFAVSVNGLELDVIDTRINDFAVFDLHGPVEVEVRVLDQGAVARHDGGEAGPGHVAVRPLSLGIEPAVDGEAIRFRLDAPANVCIDVPGLEPMFLYANPPETDRPDPDDPKVHYFRGGQVYEVGVLELAAGETLYLEGGAWVRGAIRATGTEGVRVCGRGVFDGTYFARGSKYRRLALFTGCTAVTVEDVLFTKFGGWTCMFHECHKVHVRNLKEITATNGSDGIDVVSSRDVLVEGCCLRNGDDCIVVKAFSPDDPRHGEAQDVDGVVVQGCTLLNVGGGNALEIGHELRSRSVRNITFRDCDILAVHGQGAAFSINNCEHATVSDVLYEDIRVEHYYDMLFSFRIVHSRYSYCPDRGRVENVLVRNLRIHQSKYNIGYSMSIIGGPDPGHSVDGVVFENVCLDDRKAEKPADLDLFTLNAGRIEFK